MQPSDVDTVSGALENRLAVEQSAQVGAALNGSNTAIHAKRREAAKQFVQIGLPRPKDEAWKYTNIRREFDRPFSLSLDPSSTEVSAAVVNSFAIPELDAHRIVLVNGHFSPEHSDIGKVQKGIVVKDLRSASSENEDLVNRFLGRYTHAESEVFEALNTAFVLDGVFVYVPRGIAMDRPVHIISIACSSDPILIQPRIVIAAEANAQVKIIESSVTTDDTAALLNSVVELYSSRDARVEYYRLQLENEHTSSVTSTNVFQEQSSYAKTTTITLGGRVVRNNLRFLPSEEFCETHLTGIVIADGSMHVDNHTSVDHAVPNCVSNELYKNILDDQSTGVFNGRVLVRQDAQKTRAYQSNKSVVLNDAAKMYSKPELEIYADDVLCSHGAATGNLDPESLFYLRSRGLSADSARRMMLQAFSSDVTSEIGIAALRDHVFELVSERL